MRGCVFHVVSYMSEAGTAHAPSVAKSRATAKPSGKGRREKAAEGRPVRPARTTKSTPARKLKLEEVKQGRIGPDHLTRFERARILGARALQLSLGAPPLTPLPDTVRDPISIARLELENRALPISIRRILPTGEYQNIPVAELLK
jgi:DNA-directed RNA polymerase I, II, and III subunit RPABC2